MTFIKVMWKGVKKSSLVEIIKNRNNRKIEIDQNIPIGQKWVICRVRSHNYIWLFGE